MIEAVEKIVSYCSDVENIEASSWEGSQFSSLVEGGEKAVSYGGDLTRVEASRRKTRQGAPSVEEVKEVISYCSADVARIETSAWEARQGASVVEGGEKIISHIGRTISEERHLWHIAYIHITRRGSNFRDKRVQITILKRPPTCSPSQR